MNAETKDASSAPYAARETMELEERARRRKEGGRKGREKRERGEEAEGHFLIKGNDVLDK